jgi:NRPS condensation-like uncharacterized protein
MELKDFYELKIGQDIYYKGKIITISVLSISLKRNIGFIDDTKFYFEEIMHELSFTPPKEKKKYWLWAATSLGGDPRYEVTKVFYDDESKDTNSRVNEWLKMTDSKQKLEYTMIEV